MQAMEDKKGWCLKFCDKVQGKCYKFNTFFSFFFLRLVWNRNMQWNIKYILRTAESFKNNWRQDLKYKKQGHKRNFQSRRLVKWGETWQKNWYDQVKWMDTNRPVTIAMEGKLSNSSPSGRQLKSYVTGNPDCRNPLAQLKTQISRSK